LDAFSFDHYNFPYWSGVDVFFVLSGFIMVYTSAKLYATRGAWKIFLVKRFKRIVPLYWFYTSLMVAVVMIVPSLLDTARPDWMHYLTSYLFIPYEREAGGVKPILSLGWTLNYEMFFYFVFAALLCCARSKLIKIISLIFVALATTHYFISPDMAVIYFWTMPIILEFIVGAWIAHLYMNGVRIHVLWRWVLLAFAIALYIGYAFIPQDWMAIAPRIIPAIIAVCLVASFTLPSDSMQIRVPKILKSLGDSSYSLYLAHPFFIGAIAVLTLRFDLNPYVQMGTTVIISIIGSHIAYLIIEKPLSKFLNRTK
jgi:exopolysaccharide production protein ExoZ